MSALLVESATTSPRLVRMDFTAGTSDVAFAYFTRTSTVETGTVESARARSVLFTTWMMPPSSVTPARPCDSSTALNARSHGWFLISAETLPATPLLTTMVRPLKAANPATTSMISALSHVTVMRGAVAGVGREVLVDRRLRLARLGRGDARGRGRRRGRRDRLGSGRPRRGERGGVGD